MTIARYRPSTFLNRVVDQKRDELDIRTRKEPIAVLKERISGLDEQWSLARAILEGPRGPKAGGKRIQIIAEIKKHSPSKGRLVSSLDHHSVARTYTVGGAAAISVITERNEFKGELQYLLDARTSLHRLYPGGRPAMLRKDFLFDPYHLWEARAYGADAILLIVAVVKDEVKLRDLIQQSQELQMEVLVETRDAEEIELALRVDADLIGINQRNLERPQDIDSNRTATLRSLIPAGKVVVSESGIESRAQMEELASLGVHAALIGSALMQAPDVLAKLNELLV